MKNLIDDSELIITRQMIEILGTVNNEWKQRNKDSLGTLNLYDLNGLSHLENYHSNILAYLLDGNKNHRHPEFGNQFIRYVNNEYLSNKLPAYTWLSVYREKATDKRRRIDIFLETDSFCIIIENKIYALDQGQQLIDYYSWAVQQYQNKQVFLCYLTIDGSLPDEYSIPGEKLEELCRQGKYVSLSYSKDILAWLQSLKTIPSEKVLAAALIQYIDLLQGLCSQREEDFMELKAMVNTMRSMCSQASQIELSQYQKSAQLLERTCNYYVFRSFLLELGRNLAEEARAKSYKYSVCLTHHQGRFALENLEEWEHSILNDFKDIGLELPLGDSVGIGFEINEFFPKPTLSFGIMVHGKQKEYSFHLNPAWETKGSDYFTINKDNSEWWKEFVNVGYILKTLFIDQSTELDINKISNWVIEEWEYNSQFHNQDNAN